MLASGNTETCVAVFAACLLLLPRGPQHLLEELLRSEPVLVLHNQNPSLFGEELLEGSA